MLKHNFTLIEILIVLVVVGLVLAVATPKIMRESDRMTVENSLTAIRGVVNDTAMRSRCTNQALTLTLDTEAHSFLVASSDDSLERHWTPPVHQTSDVIDNKASFIRVKDSYSLPDAIEWTPSDDNYDNDGNIVFTFFPDGQAAARELTFTVCGRNFALQIDRITANPVILELLD
ncbi:MAG: prepilin-type N-terminal cleavage/methylation domain-containing protein [Victivallales bacterium]|nr:prepilin-type N-terminal cleavage/methylation domain-containing protein [Victivallales bacterium]